MLNIKHDQLIATINPLGAELSSLQLNAQEFLWQGNKNIWSGRAPILFPIVGTLANDEMSYRGKTYQMMRHGFVRNTAFDCIAQTDSALSMTAGAAVILHHMAVRSRPAGLKLICPTTVQVDIGWHDQNVPNGSFFI